MDNSSDDTIIFDMNGHCNYCIKALEMKPLRYFPNDDGNERLNKLIEEVKEKGKTSQYDCFVGVSGGLDSSYLLYLGYKWGLRIICVHFDDGFDSDIAKSNLRKLKKATGYDFININPDIGQYNALIKAYMRAVVPGLDIPQDNIMSALLYAKADELGIKYLLSGENFALESILQRGNKHSTRDIVNLIDINKRHGEEAIDKLVFMTRRRRKMIEKKLGIKTFAPLNLMEYNGCQALSELMNFCGYQYCGGKHLENDLTAFLQLYWLPKKFGVDRRSSHLSSMIISEQISRREALATYLDTPLYEKEDIMKIIDKVKERLSISDEEFTRIIDSEPCRHIDYKTDKAIKIYDMEQMIRSGLGKIKRKIVNT
jgi:hypothetical protein